MHPIYRNGRRGRGRQPQTEALSDFLRLSGRYLEIEPATIDALIGVAPACRERRLSPVPAWREPSRAPACCGGLALCES